MMHKWGHLITLLSACLALLEQPVTGDVKDSVKDLQEAEQKEADTNNPRQTTLNQINRFLSSTPYIKALGYNSITQLYNIKDYGKKLGLSGEELFEALRTLHGKPHGSFLKRCKKTDDIYSDDTLPIPEKFDCCPFPNIKCRKIASKYRTIDGSCNCKKNAHMGRSNRAYARFLQPDYADGINAPRAAKSGHPLPSARLVSTLMFKAQQEDIKSEILTVMHMTLGQFLDHDTDRTPISQFQASNGTLVDITCGEDNCATEGPTKKECFPITVPEDEQSVINLTCMEFVRSQAFMADGCKIGPREQPNVVTSWIDCSFLYGSSMQELEKIRAKNKNRGRMAVTKHPLNNKCRALAPTQADKGCKGLDPSGPIKCFLTGDARQNEQLGIISMHIIFIRLHNLFEKKLHKVNPHWNGERLFQETRKLVIAVWNNIAFSEYIPPLLGYKETKKHGLLLKDECYKGYDCKKYSSDATNVFATAAFRFGHSQVTEKIMLSGPSFGEDTKRIPYQSVLFRPHTIYETHFDNTTCGVDAVMLGHAQQLTDQSDEVFPDSMRNHLFADNPPYGFGLDLAAIDVQRGRDHGLPGYNVWRKWCKLPVAKNFSDLVDIPQRLHAKLEELYEHVDDVDVFVGGMIENHVQGGILGSTFACIIGRQFKHMKVSDRFWFERCHKGIGYSLKQIRNIKQYSSGRLLCDTLDRVTSIQKFTMMKPRSVAEQNFSHDPKELKQVLKLYQGEDNKKKPCKEHPGIDFSLFKED